MGRNTHPDAGVASASPIGKMQTPHRHTRTQNGPILRHLCVKHMRHGQIAELEQSIKPLREGKGVWTQRIPAERRAFKLSHVLDFLEACLLQGFTHFLNTTWYKTGHTRLLAFKDVGWNKMVFAYLR